MVFQGVVCYGFGANKSVKDLLDLNTSSVHHGIDCYELKLENKYYQTKIHLFDYNQITDDNSRDSILGDCHAVILHGNEISAELLDEKVRLILDNVGGEPRLLVCDHDETLRDWSLKNGFELIDAGDENVKSQMIDSLSAYKWPLRTDRDEEQKKLDEETIRKLMDFDYLLNKVKTCRDNPDDKKIHEIGQLLSGLLGDGIDNFLVDDDDDDDDDNHNDEVDFGNGLDEHKDGQEVSKNPAE